MSDEMLPAAEGKPKRYTIKGKIKHIQQDPPKEVERGKSEAIALAKELNIKIEIQKSGDGLTRIRVHDSQETTIISERDPYPWSRALGLLQREKERREYFARKWSEWERVV